ncbi:MAG: hypothetical protein H7249_12780 [Chitinophagaceae bacterium]|nr:hypothetical protein [Oligoflexus sp.]
MLNTKACIVSFGFCLTFNAACGPSGPKYLGDSSKTPGNSSDANDTAYGLTANTVTKKVTLKTLSPTYFLSAENQGGSIISANRTAAQGWETFDLLDSDGGELVSGDSVYLRSSGGFYLQLTGGNGTALNISNQNPGLWETFKIVKQSGTGVIQPGDIIGLQSAVSNLWVSALNGGGSGIDAHGIKLDAWESFAINFVSSMPVTSNIPTASSSSKLGTEFAALSGTLKGLASWYRANASADSTNGTGWCGRPYTNDTKGFAPPFIKMSPTLATWTSNPEQWKKDTAKWCGLEARVTNPKTGKSELLYIVDAFEPTWVRTEFAIDILIGPFISLVGNPNGDKNVVVQDMQWELTGNRKLDW